MEFERVSTLEMCKDWDWETSDEENKVQATNKIPTKSVTSVLSTLSLNDNGPSPIKFERPSNDISSKRTESTTNPDYESKCLNNQSNDRSIIHKTIQNNDRSEDPIEVNGNAALDPEKVYYRPADPSNKEEDMFGQEIEIGVNFDKYDEIPVKVTGNDVCEALNRFADCEMSPLLAINIQKSGYTYPTPIQKHAIPTILSGRDLMGCAQTGSGKTAAFLVPMIQTLLTKERPLLPGQPHVLIVTPTRELSIQIFNEARKFSHGSFVRCGLLYGGTSVRHQSYMLRPGCHILVVTPGRLLDFLEKEIIRFDSLRFVVLDEADRMMDMGFMPSIKELMEHRTMPKKRQTLMFSATFPDEIQKMAGIFLENYIFIAIGIVGGACADVNQTFLEVKKYSKRDKLLELLTEEEVNLDGTMVFVETKRTADFLASYLSDMQVPTTSIHGDRYQQQREQALADFKANRMKVLICTSVASRGLDIKGVKHVINYDLPDEIEDYVHRIGRTGRMGNQGMATSFFDIRQDSELAGDLVKILHQADQTVPSFLLNVGVSGGAMDSRKKRFGGDDVRKPRDYYDREPKVQEPEEFW